MKWIKDLIRGVFNRILSFTPLGIVQRVLAHWKIVVGGLLIIITLIVVAVAFLLPPQKPTVRATPTPMPAKTATVKPMATGTPPSLTPGPTPTPKPTGPSALSGIQKIFENIKRFMEDPKAPFKEENRVTTLAIAFTLYCLASLLELTSRLDWYDIAWLVAYGIVIASIKSPFLQTREAAWVVTIVPIVIGVCLSISGGAQGPDFSPTQDVLMSISIAGRMFKSLGGMNLALAFKPGQWFPLVQASTLVMNNAKLKDWMLFLAFLMVAVAWLTILAEKKSKVGAFLLTIGVAMLAVPFLTVINELLKGTAVWLSVFCYMLLFFSLFIGVGELSRTKKGWIGIGINLFNAAFTVVLFLFLPKVHWLALFSPGLILCILLSFVFMGRDLQSGEAFKGKGFWRLLTFPWETVKWYLAGVIALLMAAP